LKYEININAAIAVNKAHRSRRWPHGSPHLPRNKPLFISWLPRRPHASQLSTRPPILQQTLVYSDSPVIVFLLGLTGLSQNLVF